MTDPKSASRAGEVCPHGYAPGCADCFYGDTETPVGTQLPSDPEPCCVGDNYCDLDSSPLVEWPAATSYPLGDLMEHWHPGHGEHSWAEEIAEQIEDRDGRLTDLILRIHEGGFRGPLPGEEPVILGDDGRVWSGHHRIAAAFICGVAEIPVAFMESQDQAADNPCATFMDCDQRGREPQEVCPCGHYAAVHSFSGCGRCTSTENDPPVGGS